MQKIIFLVTVISLTILVSNCEKKNPTEKDNTPTAPITVTDIDGNIYQTVTIGNQQWMSQNLKVTHYRNGDPIPNVTDTAEWTDLTTGAYCAYNNDEATANVYGYLYNRYTLFDSRNVAPAGWHVPTDEDWKELELFLGMSESEVNKMSAWRGTNEGDKLKEVGTAHWNSPNSGATNESGFTALPGGRRAGGGDYNFLGDRAFFSSSTEMDDGVYVVHRGLSIDFSGVVRNYDVKREGYSLRCVKD